MGKLYTLDNKLLTDTPEIRIGEKVYAVDNRQKTVKKMNEIFTKNKDEGKSLDGIDDVLALALGKKAAQEIDEMNMPQPAYMQMFSLIMAAMTGEDEDTAEGRFQQQ